MGMPEIPVIFEDENLLVINKPANLAVHAARAGSAPTLVDWLLWHYPTLAAVGESQRLADGTFVPRPGLVHRLDRDTTGVLVVAKNQLTYLELKEKFKNHEVEKTYQAIVYGEVKKTHGVIDLPIGRSKKDPRRRVASKNAHGKLRAAITNYELEEKFKGFSLLKLFPQTGRTHQLRVHLKAIGYPIVADQLYAPGRSSLPTITRQALHAARINFELNHRHYDITAPWPTDLKAALEYLRGLC